MDWSKGFSAACYMTLVDPVTWRDGERVEITGGSVSRKDSGLRQSADVTSKAFSTERERWVRIWMEAAQEGDTAREPLFTGLTSVPEEDIDGFRTEYPLVCSSVLKPAEDVLLPRGWFAPEGFNGASVAAELLSVTPAPVVIDGIAPTLSQAIIAEDGENRLSMADKVLEAINWRMRIDGDGTIVLSPPATEVRAVFGGAADMIEPRLKKKADWTGCPNVFRAVSGDENAVARDDSVDSPLSTVARGREVWMEETNCVLNSGESLEQYAQRRLEEEQAVVSRVTYARRFDPAVNVGDRVRLHYPAQGLTEEYTVTSQSMDLTRGARTSEEVQK